MKTNRWMLVALVPSLALNLFALSFLAGHWTGRWSGPVAALSERIPYPPEIRRLIVSELRAKPGEAMRTLLELRAARARMFDVQRAETLDPAAVQASQAEVRDATSRLQAVVQNVIAQALEKATAADRARIDGPPAFDLSELDGLLGE